MYICIHLPVYTYMGGRVLRSPYVSDIHNNGGVWFVVCGFFQDYRNLWNVVGGLCSLYHVGGGLWFVLDSGLLDCFVFPFY